MKTLLLAIVILAVLAVPVQAEVLTNASEIRISWTASPADTDLAGFELFASDSPTGTFSKIHADLIPLEEYVLVDHPEGEHYFKVRAVDICGNVSEFSVVSERLLIDRTAPGAPTSITISVTTTQ